MKTDITLKPKNPRLAYVGMDKKTVVEAVPTQVIEVVSPAKALEQTVELGGGQTQESLWGEKQVGLSYTEKVKAIPKNRIIWTNDNLVALKTLLDEKDDKTGEYKYRNKVDLIYIDPPFMVQNDFVADNSIDIEVDEQEGVVSVKEPTIIETIAYKDTWQNGLDSFLHMIRERLELMKELLSSSGTIYVHLDWHSVHYVKTILDEIFGYENLVNEIIWKRTFAHGDVGQGAQHLGRLHDTLLMYKKTDDFYMNFIYVPYEADYIEKTFKKMKNGRRYQTISLIGPGGANKGNPYYEFMGVKRFWVYSKENMEKLLKEGKIEQTKEGNVPRKIMYLDESPGVPLQDIWNDIPPVQGGASESTGYPTQKPVELLKRIILTSCPKNGFILDAFVGSGTTCEAAEQLVDELGCSWIGIDNSKFAIHTARKRLIELNGKPKRKKGEGVYKVRPFTVENIGYYQRGVKWDPIQTSGRADAYRKAIVELFGGEYLAYSKLLHGKKRGAWIHVGPLSTPIMGDQLKAIVEEVKDTEFKKVYVLSADFTAHNQSEIESIKAETGIQIMVKLIPASAIEEVRKRMEMVKKNSKEPDKASDMLNIAFFTPITAKVKVEVDNKEVCVKLSGLEVDAESFLDSQKPERRGELEKWLGTEKSWQSFLDFWAVDWDFEDLKDKIKEPVFENEWQSFRKRKNNKTVEDIVYQAYHTYEQPGEYTIAVKVTDVFGNDGIITQKLTVK